MMTPQSIKEAFDMGWNIKTEGEAEKIAFLYECSDLDMRWVEGQAVMDYIPCGKRQIYFSITSVCFQKECRSNYLVMRAVHNLKMKIPIFGRMHGLKSATLKTFWIDFFMLTPKPIFMSY